MARTTDQVMAEILAIEPPGWGVPHGVGTVRAAFLRPIADAIATFEAADDAFQAACVDPRQPGGLLADYERDLGPDPCGVDPAKLDTATRITRMRQRWFAGAASPTVGAVQAIAASNGETATVAKLQPFTFGISRFATGILGPAQAFVLRVTLPIKRVAHFQFGTGRFNDSWFGSFGASLSTCPIRQIVPDHLTVVFTFQ